MGATCRLTPGFIQRFVHTRLSCSAVLKGSRSIRHQRSGLAEVALHGMRVHQLYMRRGWRNAAWELGGHGDSGYTDTRQAKGEQLHRGYMIWHRAAAWQSAGPAAAAGNKQSTAPCNAHVAAARQPVESQGRAGSHLQGSGGQGDIGCYASAGARGHLAPCSNPIPIVICRCKAHRGLPLANTAPTCQASG